MTDLEKLVEDLNSTATVTPVDRILPAGDTKDWKCQWVTNVQQGDTQWALGKRWVVLGPKDPDSVGAFGIIDISDDTNNDRLSVCYYPDVNYDRVVEYYKDNSIKITKRDYFDILYQDTLGIWNELKAGKAVFDKRL